MEKANQTSMPVDVALQKFHERNAREHFFGIVELHYKDGHLVCVKRQEVLHPANLIQLASE